MTIQIGGYNFDGPYPTSQSLQSRSGVYAILGANGTGNYSVVDIGESGNVSQRVSCHDRAPDWCRQGKSLWYAGLCCDETNRMRIEKELRIKYNPPCGDR